MGRGALSAPNSFLQLKASLACVIRFFRDALAELNDARVSDYSTPYVIYYVIYAHDERKNTAQDVIQSRPQSDISHCTVSTVNLSVPAVVIYCLPDHELDFHTFQSKLYEWAHYQAAEPHLASPSFAGPSE